MRYVYLGDRWTGDRWLNQPCDPVRDSRGKCVVRGGTALVRFAGGEAVSVNRRRLRLAKKEPS